MNEHHPIGDIMATTLQKIKELIDGDTIVGQPIVTPDGLTLIPVSKVSLGFASGGSEFSKTPKAEGKTNFGGGSGAGVKVEPVAFLMVRGDTVRLLPVDAAPMNTMDRVVDMVPQVMDKVSTFLDQRKVDKGEL